MFNSFKDFNDFVLCSTQDYAFFLTNALQRPDAPGTLKRYPAEDDKYRILDQQTYTGTAPSEGNVTK